MEETEDKQEFVVRDKRRFSPEGESEGASKPANEGAPKGRPEAAAESGPAEEQPSGSEQTEQRQALPVDFSSFVLSMANSALYHMGFLTFQDAEPKKDLPAARQTIDLLALLEEKTKGNLTEQEQKILKETLFQLRMAFVEAAK